MAPETTIKPASLERGENPDVLQLLGRTILEGGERIKVPGREVQLLGKSGNDYVALADAAVRPARPSARAMPRTAGVRRRADRKRTATP